MNLSFMLNVIFKCILWITPAPKGRIKMSHPELTLIKFSYEDRSAPKIIVEGAMRSTAAKGNDIQTMILRVKRPGSAQDFILDGYEEEGRFYSGSNLKVPESGRRPKLHFAVRIDDTAYRFYAGMYTISFLAYDEEDKERVVCTIHLEITEDLIGKMKDKEIGLKFTWDPQVKRYTGSAVNVQRYSGF